MRRTIMVMTLALLNWLLIWVPDASAQQFRRPSATPQQSASGGLSGIYRAAAKPGENVVGTLAFNDPAAKSPNFKFLVFFPDGRVKRGLILGGMDGQVPESSMRLDISSGGKFATQWGKYLFSGGRGRMVFASAAGGVNLTRGLSGDAWDFTGTAGRLEVNGDTYDLLDGGNGIQLEGVYKPFGDASQPGIQFTQDGQFVDQGIFDNGTAMAIAVAGGGVVNAYGFSPPKAGRGVYYLSNYGLCLHYSVGKNPCPLFFLEPGSNRVDVKVLYISNMKYQRVP